MLLAYNNNTFYNNNIRIEIKNIVILIAIGPLEFRHFRTMRFLC